MEPTFTPEAPTALFEADTSLEDFLRGLQDISSDGQRFLVIITRGSSGQDVLQLPQINIVQNWHQELLERVPVN